MYYFSIYFKPHTIIYALDHKPLQYLDISILCDSSPRGSPQGWLKHVGDVLCLYSIRYFYAFMCICWSRYRICM